MFGSQAIKVSCRKNSHLGSIHSLSIFLSCPLIPSELPVLPPSLSNEIVPVGVVTSVLLHAAEGVPFPVQPVSQKRVEDMRV